MQVPATIEPVPTSRVILIADDNADDLFLLRRSLQQNCILNPIQEVRSGHEAIAYLNGGHPYEDRARYPFPGILLLDLHMPKGDGFEVLTWIRDKLESTGLLIIVLSRLNEIKDINRAYALGAKSFLTKPGDPQELRQLINAFKDYWIVRNKPPEN